MNVLVFLSTRKESIFVLAWTCLHSWTPSKTVSMYECGVNGLLEANVLCAKPLIHYSSGVLNLRVLVICNQLSRFTAVQKTMLCYFCTSIAAQKQAPTFLSVVAGQRYSLL